MKWKIVSQLGRGVISLVAFLVLGGGCSVFERPASIELPKRLARIQPEVLDLGRLYQGVDVDTELSFENLGELPVTITEWRTSCHCLSWLEPKPIVVGAKDSSKVSLRFKSGGFIGRQSKELVVVADDEMGVHTCRVDCEIIPAAEHISKQILGSLATGESHEVIFDLSPGPSGESVEVGQVLTTDPSLRWVSSHSKDFGSGKGTSVRLSLLPYGSGPFSIRVDFKLTKPAVVTSTALVEYSIANE